MTRPLVILTTLETRDDAAKVIRILIEEELIACGSIVPGVESIYRWKREIEQSNEVLLILKSVETRLKALRERLLELHVYEVPEFIALSPKEVSPSYLEWLHQSCELEPEE